jgi:hypothetical protein
LKKLPYFRDANGLPGVFITGESITNTNSSTNIPKNLESFLGMPIGTRRSCLMKKTEVEKYRDTVPLNIYIDVFQTNNLQKIKSYKCLYKKKTGLIF